MSVTDSTPPQSPTTPPPFPVGTLAMIGLGCLVLASVAWWSTQKAPVAKVQDQKPTTTALSTGRSTNGASSPLARPDARTQGYVGSEACQECHAEIAKRYAQTPMARSFSPVIPEHGDPPEDYHLRTAFEKGPLHYQVERRDGRVWHHEALHDAEGPIYDQAEEIHYAMGSNTRGRSFLMWRQGEMFVSPIAWYTEHGWDLSPGYELPKHQRFSRPVGEECLWCHCGQLQADQDRLNIYPREAFFEHAIGCERCHGPGKAHIDFRRAQPKGSGDPIARLAELSPPRRDAVCYQCHFQGEARILRSDRREGDFRPGELLTDTWLVFVAGTGANRDSTKIVSQPMQMHSSRCFQQSNGKLGCVTCHDPHDSPTPELKADFYNQRCDRCHSDKPCSLPSAQQQAAPASGSCIHCHMPSLSAQRVPHTSQSDHRILRRPTPIATDAPETEWVIFQEAEAAIPRAEGARATGIMLAYRAEGNRDLASASTASKLLNAVQRETGRADLDYYMANCAHVATRDWDAELLWKRSIKSMPLDPRPPQHYASFLYYEGRFAESDRYFGEADKIQPLPVQNRACWADALYRVGKHDVARRQIEAVLAEDPTIVELYPLIAELYSAQGDSAKAAAYRQQGERIAALQQRLRKR